MKRILTEYNSIDKLLVMQNNMHMEEVEQPVIKETSSTGDKFRLFIIDTLQTFLFAGGFFLLIYFFLFRPFQVSGNSMYSSFKDKEYILTNLISLRFADPKRGDVIVFKSPTDPNKDFIKRVIALPGDKILIKNGEVYVNSKKIDESEYLDKGVKTFGGAFIQEGDEKIVPPGNYAVMGDNREDSSDFRQWGFLNRNNIIGISLFVYWPINHIRIIKNPLDQK